MLTLLDSSVPVYLCTTRSFVRSFNQPSRFEMSFHVDRSFAEIFSSCITDLHQSIISFILSLHGLPLLLVPSFMPNTNAFSFLLSSLLQMWPNSCSFLCIAGPSRFSVCHRFLYWFLARDSI